MAANLAKSIVVSYLFAYRNLTDAEIQTYLKFLRTPAGIRFHGTVTKALGYSMRVASAGAGRNLAGKLSK